jgi:hypothetical protein
MHIIETSNIMNVPQVKECVAAAHHWYQWHPSIGECSVILAFVSFFAALRWDKMGRMARGSCAFLFFILLSGELYSIHRDGVERNEDQKLAECRMQTIADNIQKGNSEAQTHYQATITKVDNVLDTAKDVQKLSATNLLNTTGGNAYCYVMPRYKIRRMGPFPGSALFTNSFRIYNDFDQLLSGITVKMSTRTPAPGDPNRNTIPQEYHIGSVGPHSSERIDYMPDPEYWSADSLSFRITVGAQNGDVLENLNLRPTKDKQRGEYEFDVIRPATKRLRGHKYIKDSSGILVRGERGVYLEIVKHQDWTEREQYLQ